jgi:hypothetical protein
MVTIFMIELDGVNLLGRDISPCPDSDVGNIILDHGRLLDSQGELPQPPLPMPQPHTITLTSFLPAIRLPL